MSSRLRQRPIAEAQTQTDEENQQTQAASPRKSVEHESPLRLDACVQSSLCVSECGIQAEVELKHAEAQAQTETIDQSSQAAVEHCDAAVQCQIPMAMIDCGVQCDEHVAESASVTPLAPVLVEILLCPCSRLDHRECERREAELQSMLQEKERAINDLRVELERVTGSNRQLNEAAERERAAILTLGSRLEAADSRCKVLERQRAEFQVLVRGLTDENAAVKAIAAETLHKLKAAQGEQDQAKLAIKAIANKFQAEQSKLRASEEQLQAELAECQKSHREAERATALLNSQIETLQTELSSSNTRAEQLADALAVKRLELDSANEAIQELKTAKRAMEQELEAIELECRDKLERSNQEAEQIESEWRSKLEEMQERNAALKREVDLKMDLFGEIEREIEDIKTSQQNELQKQKEIAQEQQKQLTLDIEQERRQKEAALLEVLRVKEMAAALAQQYARQNERVRALEANWTKHKEQTANIAKQLLEQ